MRRLSRLLIKVRDLKNNKKLTLENVLQPSYFKYLITGTQAISEYNSETRSFDCPSLALQKRTLLKHAINATYSIEIQKSNPDAEKIKILDELT